MSDVSAAMRLSRPILGREVVQRAIIGVAASVRYSILERRVANRATGPSAMSPYPPVRSTRGPPRSTTLGA